VTLIRNNSPKRLKNNSDLGFLGFQTALEFRGFRGSRRITDKTETQKVKKRVRIELELN
jgi:hypothetical protein